MTVDEKLRKGVMEAKVVRGMLNVSDHYAVLAKIKTRNINKNENKK